MPDPKHKSPVFLKELEQIVWKSNRLFWLSTRFLPRADRLHALCWLGLDAELQRIVHSASDPMIALIRLQWWRDGIEGDMERFESLQSIAAACVKRIIQFDNSNAANVGALLDAYCDVAEMFENHCALKLLSGIMKSQDRASLIGGLWDASLAGQLTQANLGAVVDCLNNVPDDEWPWYAALEFLPDNVAKRDVGPLEGRWRMLWAFLGGEARLKKKLLQFMKQLPLDTALRSSD